MVRAKQRSRCSAASLLLAACSPPAWVETPPAQRQAIVNGTRQPQQVELSAGQVLAIGFLADAGADNFCTGTVIAPRLVITARHCVDSFDASEVYFGIGEQPSEALALVPVQVIHLHDDLDSALLVLGQDAVALVPEVVPIEVRREALDATWQGTWADASGYGETYSDATGRFFAAVQIVDVDSEFVTVDGHGEQGICYGDSGGPLLVESDGAVVILATETTGDSTCVDIDYLTRTDMIVDWIDDIVAAGLPPTLVACTENTCVDGLFGWCADGYLRTGACEDGACGYLSAGEYGCLPAECDGIDYLGTCDGNELRWCKSSGLHVRDCAAQGLTCVWQDATVGYVCDECDSCNSENNDTLEEDNVTVDEEDPPRKRRRASKQGCSQGGGFSIVGSMVALVNAYRRRCRRGVRAPEPDPGACS